MTKSKFLKPKDVAQRLLISERSVLRYVHTKKIPATKIGQWRIREIDLDNFIKSRMNIKPRKRTKKSRTK